MIRGNTELECLKKLAKILALARYQTYELCELNNNFGEDIDRKLESIITRLYDRVADISGDRQHDVTSQAA
jgi:hypothetical protein